MRYLLVLLVSLSTLVHASPLRDKMAENILPYLIAANSTTSISERYEYTQSVIATIDYVDSVIVSSGTPKPEEKAEVDQVKKALKVCRNSAVRIWESTEDMRINGTSEINKCVTEIEKLK